MCANPVNLALERAAIDAEWRALLRGEVTAETVAAVRASMQTRHAAHLAYVQARVAALPRRELAQYADAIARRTATVAPDFMPHCFWDLANLAEVARRDPSAATILSKAGL